MSAPPDVLEAADGGGRGGRLFQGACQGARGVTQVDPLSPTIFNVTVDALVRHLVTVMVEGLEEWGERGQ